MLGETILEKIGEGGMGEVYRATDTKLNRDVALKNQAFEWLERSYQKRDAGLIYLIAQPGFDPIRDDPRFQDLLRRMNLEP